MTNNRKWLCFGSLTVAGLLSLLLSFLGTFGLSWGGFPNDAHSAFLLVMFLPFLLAFPLFVLAVGVSNLAAFALWICVPFLWITWFGTSVHDFKGGPLEFAKFLALCCCATLPLLILAALVQFGTHFYEFTYDRRWVRWKEASQESAS